ncbi:hypothetical protein MBANPS3_003254 [Mucor bainieri]
MFKYTNKNQQRIQQQQQHEFLITSRASKTTHVPEESITTSREAMHSDKCRLLDLPIELLHRIFVYAQNPTLAITCRRFWSLGQSAMLRADYLMHRYGPTAVLGETAMRRHIVSLPTIHQLLRLNCDPTADVQVGRCNVAHLINLAAMKGSIGVVDLLVNEFGANVYHDNVLASACRENQVKLVKHLVETYSINVHSLSERHLRNACLHGFLELAKFLLDGANVHAYNDAAIQNASYKGFNDIVALLLDAGAHADSNQNACIQHAVNNNDLNMVKCLIEKGGVDPRCNHDWPLRHSCQQGFNAIVEYLHRRIGTFDIGDGILLELALAYDQLDTLKLLLKKGANPNCNGVLRGVKYAVNPKNKSRHKDEMIQSLLGAGFEINRQNESMFMMSDNKLVSSLIS